jgi:asparagine synthase (glutamine-hydrolysing)
MSQSRETRVPFLDHNLVEFCLKLPSEYKIHNGWTKRVLRESVKDILPEAIYRRHDKQGYSSPVKNWASGELKSFFMENLRESSGLPFLKKETILNGFREFAGTKGWFDPVWWRVAVTGRWIKIFKIKL